MKRKRIWTKKGTKIGTKSNANLMLLNGVKNGVGGENFAEEKED